MYSMLRDNEKSLIFKTEENRNAHEPLYFDVHLEIQFDGNLAVQRINSGANHHSQSEMQAFTCII